MQASSRTTSRSAALTAGIAIVTMGLAAVIATDVSIGALYAEGDPMKTAANIAASMGLFRVGVLAWVVVFIADLLTAWGLYVYLRPVASDLSLLAAWFRVVYAALLGSSITHLVEALYVLDHEDGTAQMQLRIHALIEAFNADWSFALIVFGFHIGLIGLLILKSGEVPTYLGALLLAAAVGYLLHNGLKLVTPRQTALIQTIGYIFIVPMLSEAALGVWLLVRAGKVENVERRTRDRATSKS